jgi:hypothetical protein
MRKFLMAGLGAAMAGGVSYGVLAATADNATQFTVKISNVSENDTLKVPGADAVKAPIAPGVYLIDPAASVVVPGGAASAELQALAEDGNFEPLQTALAEAFGAQAGMFAPGLSFEVAAKPGDRLSFATMFVQSNDKFYAPAGGSIALFDALGNPVSGDLTAVVRMYDAGTEIDQQPGAGADQAPRQKGVNQGASQAGVVAEANDGFVYPAVSEVIRLEITVAK